MTLPRLVGGLIFVGGLLFAVLGGEYSTSDWWILRKDIDAEREAIARLRVEVDSLAVWATAIETDSATQERVAREHYGMLREGEHAYLVVPVER